MSSRPQSGVVDERGESWQVAGLYIADASALPTSTGDADTTVHALTVLTARKMWMLLVTELGLGCCQIRV